MFFSPSINNPKQNMSIINQVLKEPTSYGPLEEVAHESTTFPGWILTSQGGTGFENRFTSNSYDFPC